MTMFQPPVSWGATDSDPGTAEERIRKRAHALFEEQLKAKKLKAAKDAAETESEARSPWHPPGTP